MTIKKLKTVSRPAPAAGATPSDGDVAEMPTAAAPKTGAAIASRLKLDAPDPESLRASASSKKAAQIALTVALIALAVAGILTFTLYKHWEFLMPV